MREQQIRNQDGLDIFPRPSPLEDTGCARARILMSAYYCSPSKGSDWRVGWGRAMEAARRFEVFVITSEESRSDIEGYIALHGPVPHLQFYYVALEEADRWIGKIPKSFLYVNPFAYALWHSQAIALARRLHDQVAFDIAHQVTLIGYREPGRLHELGIPFVWGPIGGTQNYPARFLRSAGVAGAVKEGLRSVVNSLQLRYSGKVRRAAASATVILAANSEGQRTVRHCFGRDAVLLLETGLDVIRPKAAGARTERELRILWSGDLNTHKALPLLLRALGTVREKMNFQLRILGRGPLLAPLRAEAARLGIADRCEFAGFLPLAEAMAQSEWADVFVFTSLRDTSGNVMLEAMSRGVPVVCLDHQGAGDIVDGSSGIKIPVTNPGDVIQRLARELVRLSSDPKTLEALSQGALQRAERFLWSHNGAAMASVYEEVLRANRPAPGGMALASDSDMKGRYTMPAVSSIARFSVVRALLPNVSCKSLYSEIALAAGDLVRLFPAVIANPAWELKRMTAALTIATTWLVIAYGGEGPAFDTLVLASALAALMVPLTRHLRRGMLGNCAWFGQPGFVLGGGAAMHDLVQGPERNRQGLKAVAVFASGRCVDDAVSEVPVVGGPEPDSEYARQAGVRRAIGGDHPAHGRCDQPILATAATGFPRIPLVPGADSPHGVPAILHSATIKTAGWLEDSAQQVLKRWMDVALASVVTLLTAPVGVLIAVWIGLESRGPVVYGHTRIGRNGRRFKVWKFRSMVTDGDRVLREYLAANPEAAAEWADTQKLRRDPRVTAFGNFLRKTSLDELPQLWNILRGDMSLVGPRPIVDTEVSRYGDAMGHYQKVRPGLTGLWQVSGRNNTTYQERVEFDSYYVKYWSIWLDVYVLVKTVRVVLLREGAY